MMWLATFILINRKESQQVLKSLPKSYRGPMAEINHFEPPQHVYPASCSIRVSGTVLLLLLWSRGLTEQEWGSRRSGMGKLSSKSASAVEFKASPGRPEHVPRPTFAMAVWGGTCTGGWGCTGKVRPWQPADSAKAKLSEGNPQHSNQGHLERGHSRGKNPLLTNS